MGGRKPGRNTQKCETGFERRERPQGEAEPRAMATKTSNKDASHQSEQIERTHSSKAKADRTTRTNGTTRTKGPEQPKRTPT